MKVLFLSNSFGALANFRYEFITKLCNEGHKVSLCYPFGEKTDRLDALDCEYINISLTRKGINPFCELMLIEEYRRIISRARPDIIYSYTIKPNIYGGIAAAQKSIPIVQSVTGLGTSLEKYGIMQGIATFLYRIACKKSKRIFCQNEEIMRYFKTHHIGGNRIHQIAGSGINLEHFKCLPYPKETTIDFLFIARIRKEKGIDQYLKAAECVKHKHPETVFHVVGFCDDKKYIDVLNAKEQQGVVLYHGEQKDVLPFQKISSCTIHPTYYPEGMSNVLLESAASGRPIITTDRSGCREIVEDGVNGFVCKQQDSDDLIKQIEKFLSLSWEERKNMGLAGRKKVEREFDRQIVVKAYLDELQDAIEKQD